MKPSVYKIFTLLRKIHIRNCLIGFTKYGLGDSIRIEASSLCQLKCQLCPQTYGKVGIIGSGYLKYEAFKRFVNRYPNFSRIELSNYGEIFLNPDLEEIIKYAYKQRIDLTAYNGVNLNTVSETMLETLVKYRFKTLAVSLDGATPGIYTIYRRGGNFNTVLDNVKKINDYKARYQSPLPKLIWQFILFGHNQHELALARRMANELHMDFDIRLNWSASYSPLQQDASIENEVEASSQKDYQQKHKRLYLPICQQLWISPQINWDGRLLGCCVNAWGDFGNVFDTNLKTCLKSEKYRYAKKMVLGLRSERDDIPCARCPTYKIMKSTNRYLLPFASPD